jgi:hypothetical protein
MAHLHEVSEKAQKSLIKRVERSFSRALFIKGIVMVDRDKESEY